MLGLELFCLVWAEVAGESSWSFWIKMRGGVGMKEVREEDAGRFKNS